MVRSLQSRCSRAFPACLTLQFLLLFASSALALDPGRAITQYIQSSWNTESGLPQNSVHAIAQTPNGYLWLGTEEGLTRFDGVEFTTYNHGNTPALPSDYVQALAVGRDGALWIGTDSGLAEFRPSSAAGENGKFLTMTTADGLSSNNITLLWEGSDGAVWAGTSKGLVRIFSGHVQPWPGSGALANVAVTAIVGSTDGTLWVGTVKGLFALRDGRVVSFTTHDGLPDNTITSLAAARDGSVWVGTVKAGIAQVREGHVVVPQLQLPTKIIQSLLVDRDGGLWIAFDRHGIGRLHDGKLVLYGNSQGMPSDRCTHAIFEDSEGDLWVGLLDAGLLELRDGKFAVFGKPEGLSGNYVGNLLQAQDGSMWIGADSNGLNHILPDGKVEVWNHSQGLPNQAVYSLLQTRDGSLWVGYRNGLLARIRHGQVSIYTDPAAANVPLNSIFEDREGHLWLGFWGKGLILFDYGRFRHMGGDERISQIAESHDGALWIASDGDGLQRIFHGATTRFDTSHGLPSNHVMSVYVADDGDVWTGTASGGLSRIRSNQVVSWTLKEGLLESTVGSIVEDNAGNLWFGGDNGIYRVSKQELDRSAATRSIGIHPVQYGTTDGLRSRETLYASTPSTWKAHDGRLWFATIHGAAVIDPARFLIDKIVPPTWIERIRFDSRVVPLQAGIRLGPGSGNIEATFTAPSLAAPQRVRFRYRLIGFDSGWIDAGSRRSAWYTNLPPGHYTFAVQAENGDGLWNYQGDSFRFVILPPTTRTPVAYLAYAVATIFFGWGMVAFRTRVLVRRQQELTRTVAERTAQLQAEKAALEVARRELQIQATHDSLTGIFNHAAILEHLEREISRAVREKSALGVVVADLDYFKSVNDNYGHLCGDQVIFECATRFRSALRGYDLLGRFGGEEFLILLPGWDAPTAPDRVKDLLRAIADVPIATDEADLHLTCSIGVATFDPKLDVPAPLEVLKRADAALYVAKNSGRNCVRFEHRGCDESGQLTH
jgi:diguanylate cyclase (GGDEF)-like protein